MNQEEIRYQLLKLIEKNPSLNQRDMAKAMGVSLGRTNFCVKALIDIGYVKTINFKRSHRKSAYFYALTPHGIEAKLLLTRKFLHIKRAEYAALKKEISALAADLDNIDSLKTAAHLDRGNS